MKYIIVTLISLSFIACQSETSDEETTVQTAAIEALDDAYNNGSEGTKEECENATRLLKKAKSGKKIAICHIPPGNPENAHTIVISENAHKTHSDHHGDYVGICGCGESEEEDENHDDSTSGDDDPASGDHDHDDKHKKRNKRHNHDDDKDGDCNDDDDNDDDESTIEVEDDYPSDNEDDDSETDGEESGIQL